MHHATIDGNVEVASVLIEKGANKEIKDNQQKTALDMAREYDRDHHQEIADLLQKKE